MQRFLLTLFASLFLISSAQASLVYQGSYDPDQSLQNYFEAAYPRYSKSIIFVFFNNEPCEECAQAVDLIEQVYDNSYKNQYSLFLINYQNDDEYNFIANYNLSQPLEVVLQRVVDDETNGFKKIEGLQNQVSDPVSFADNLKFQINEFLGGY